VDERGFAQTPIVAWKDFYGEVAEELPADMPEQKGNAVEIACFVDADHAGNMVTRRSETGILIYIQNAPIIWYTKKQNTVESSTFGSEFVALRAARDMIVALRYKLRMFGIPIRGPASVLCDNQGVVKNTSLPESTLSKRHNAFNYHAVREAVAAGIIRVGKEDGETNLADVFTKVLAKSRRNELFSQICCKLLYQDQKLKREERPKLVAWPTVPVTSHVIRGWQGLRGLFKTGRDDVVLTFDGRTMRYLILCCYLMLPECLWKVAYVLPIASGTSVTDSGNLLVCRYSGTITCR
jgi:hypothetical protein